MGWQIRDGQRVRVVDEAVLKAWFRQRLKNNPAHQWKMRTKSAEAEKMNTHEDAVQNGVAG